MINQKHPRHIITIEDPVEYVFKDKKSIVEQCELGINTYSLDTALRVALREDPDIIYDRSFLYCLSYYFYCIIHTYYYNKVNL